MASLTGSIGKLIYGTATALIDNEVPAKVSSAITTAVSAGFGTLTDVLKVVQEMSAPADAAKPSDTLNTDT